MTPPTYACVRSAWRSHEAELRRFLVNRLSDPHLADDLLQDVFIKAMRHVDGFCRLTNSRAWLFEVARNAVIDHFRSRKDFVEVPENLLIETDELPVVDSLASCIPLALSEMSEHDREAIMACDLQGMAQDDFARLKGLSLPGAKARVQRARKRQMALITKACQVKTDESGTVIGFTPRQPFV